MRENPPQQVVFIAGCVIVFSRKLASGCRSALAYKILFRGSGTGKKLGSFFIGVVTAG